MNDSSRFATRLRNTFRHRYAISSLIGLWLLVLLFLTAFRFFSFDDSLRAYLVVFCVGSFLGGFHLHSYRHGLFIVVGAIATFIFSILCMSDRQSLIAICGLGLSLGIAFTALLCFFGIWIDQKSRPIAITVLLLGLLPVIAISAFLRAMQLDNLLLTYVIATGTISIVAIVALFRPFLEGSLEILLWPIYRIKAIGPDAKKIPLRGPYLVIANHAAWIDPLVLAKILPAPIVPMMTSKFYDLPVISWFMRNVIGTIRVPDAALRHDAPELKEAIAALDRGECVVIFPEGYLRRKEEIPLRRFGQGVWKILAERPDTPVFSCWIEGNWGSFFSYRDGPPMKNKKFDKWRTINVGVIGPIAMKPEILEEQMKTRTFLMERVLEARDLLKLPPIDVALPKIEDQE